MASSKRVTKPLKKKSSAPSESKRNTKPRKAEVKLLTSFSELLDQKYGKRGAPARELYETGFEAFALGVLIQEARKNQNLTQEEVARRAGTTKNYISRIENDASDIRLGTLMRIVRNGLGGQVTLTF